MSQNSLHDLAQVLDHTLDNKRRILYRTVGENEAETFSSYSHSIMIRLFLLISLIIQKQEESP